MNSHDSRTPVIDIPVREAMRMAGDRVWRDRVIEVRYPWTGELVGTVPMATCQLPRKRPVSTGDPWA